MNKILEAGAYRLTDPNDSEIDVIVLVAGTAPFLKIDTIWDNKNSKPISDSVIRGKGPQDLTWEKL